jgi:ubiquinone/menaquinone biosynthesis C-methylase UbiE
MASAYEARRFMVDTVRHWSGRDRRRIDAYFQTHSVRRLHLGCGKHLLDGWLNCDLRPRGDVPDVIVQLDATEPFPFLDEQFDYTFSEHMIEHMSFEGGAAMLAESYRVLRRGGRIRISTPDLSFLVGLYSQQRSPLQQRYIDWMSTTEACRVRPPAGSAELSPPSEVFVINNFMRDWEHTFIYDERTLRYALQHAHFKNVVRCTLGESTTADLRNLENESRLPEGFLGLETFTLEVEK